MRTDTGKNKKKIREKDVERYLVERAERLGFLVRKVSWRGHRGAPDRVLFRKDGVVVWVEIKKPGGRLSTVQKNEIGVLSNYLQHVAVIYSKDDADSLFTGINSIEPR